MLDGAREGVQTVHCKPMLRGIDRKGVTQASDMVRHFREHSRDAPRSEDVPRFFDMTPSAAAGSTLCPGQTRPERTANACAAPYVTP